MGFKQKYGVFRHVVGQPLLCERSFDAQKDAEEFARNIDGSVVLSYDEFRPSYEERQESKENTFYRRDGVDLGAMDDSPETRREKLQEVKKAEDDAVAKVKLDAAQERGQKTEVQKSTNERGPKVVSNTTTPVSEKNAAASRGKETRAEVEKK